MTNPGKTFCVYHRADFDGKCSAAIVLRRYPGAELVPYDYGDDLDAEKYRDSHVIMVDCSLQPFQRMLDLAAICSHFTWIDHHKTAIEEFEKSPTKFEAHVDTKFSGCELTWQWAFPGFNMPRAVWLLGRYDLWNLDASIDVMPMQYGLRRHETNPRDDIWLDLLDDHEHPVLRQIIDDGHKILQYVEQFNREVCKHAFEVTFDGLRCICLNAPMRNSQVFDSVFNPAIHDAMLMYFNAGNHWTVSLYTTKPGIDVGAVAKARGGGGHLRAAGFQMKELPPELRP